MPIQDSRGRGKLYEVYSEKFIANISYQLHEELVSGLGFGRWSGELTLVEYVNLRGGGSYIIELEDKRKGRCFLRRRTNKAVVGVPPRYFYLLQGSGPLE